MQFKNSFFLLILSTFSIFCSSQDNIDYSVIGNINIEGNKTTKEYIIIRELAFEQGDTIRKDELEEMLVRSKENILNTSLFNFVDIKPRLNKSNLTDITIYVEERWYIWPYAILEHADRNFSNFIKDQDWNRINYGGYISVYNLRGRNEYLKIKARYGYKEQYALTYSILYIDKTKKNGFSIFLAHNKQKEIAYKTIDSKLQYYSYNNEYHFNSNEASLEYTFRNKLYFKHIINLGYHNAQISNGVMHNNPDFFKTYTSYTEFFYADYSFIYDNRDLVYYPTKGKYHDINISKIGTGILENENIYAFKVSSTINNYIKINKRLFYASKIKGLITSGTQNSFYFENALGYEDVIRGYEYYVIYGQGYCVFKSSLKWNIIPNKVKTINAIPLSKFKKTHYSLYADLFYDSGYVWDNNHWRQNNILANEYIYSVGLGLNFVTYYDKLLILEFSVNKFGEAGIFINFEAPI